MLGAERWQLVMLGAEQREVGLQLGASAFWVSFCAGFVCLLCVAPSWSLGFFALKVGNGGACSLCQQLLQQGCEEENDLLLLFFFFPVNLHPQFRPIKARSLVTRAAQYRQQHLPPRTALRDHCMNRDPPRRGDTQIPSPPRPRKTLPRPR